MKKYIIFSLLMIFLSDASAKIIRSCDGRYSAQAIGRAEMIIKRDGKSAGRVKINHDVYAGDFSLDGRSFVVYGMPNKIDFNGPQAEFVSVYILRPKLHVILRRTYGGGIYDVAIGSDQKTILVSSRFGFDVIDIDSGGVKSYDPISRPKFSRQKCKN
ncbi:hypothetical protein [Burkholderia territorii]|uniref:hypothetical protein n=1 Tax=Burkholderia territorii TaxID=1503055 RepID=UPI0012D96838|nr:hypothetical protein [Burkholderia territorii]